MDLAKAVAGAVARGGDALDIESVFSTYLYTGTGAVRDIVNGIDLATEGGMVWIKNRDNTAIHNIHDTERGAGVYLDSASTGGNVTDSDEITSFNTDGFTLGGGTKSNSVDGSDYTSWTFRKAPRFFDVVTYTGDGTSGREIAHELGVAPGMVIVKSTSNAVKDWHVAALRGDKTQYEFLMLNSIASKYSSDFIANVASSTGLIVDGTSNGGGGSFANLWGGAHYINTLDEEYIAYIFADDPLGPSGDGSDGLIACGSYTGNGSLDGPEIDLGWEAQHVTIKASDYAGQDWHIYDSMRGMTTTGAKHLRANTSVAEDTGVNVSPRATGFKIEANNDVVNRTGVTYIYMAIRRGMRTPESSDEVFAVNRLNISEGAYIPTGFTTDMHLGISDTYNYSMILDRLRGMGSATPGTNATGSYLQTFDTSAEATSGQPYFAWMNKGYYQSGFMAGSGSIGYDWKRATGFFDVVTYTGDGIAGRTVDHNLGVVPEMMIVKSRSNADDWRVYHAFNTASPETEFLQLNSTKGTEDILDNWNDTLPTAAEFTVGTDVTVNRTSATHIAYLFASLAGISKVGSYTGNGTTQTIPCGFSAGAKFVLIKRTDSTGDWYFWDTTRGIVAGNDPHLSLNTTAAEVTSDDSIDPDTTGFIVNQVAATNINVNSAEYIFYAVAI